MTDTTLSRRGFLQSATVGLAGTALLRQAAPALSTSGANERIRVGIIGPGDRGLSLMCEFFDQSAKHNAQLVAVCDLWKLRREQARQIALDKTGQAPAIYRNAEELYASRRVDAVIIATPDFSHAILCAEAARAGLDVYVEKPLAHVMEDARLVRQACLETGRIVQVGTGSRSQGVQRAAARYVRSGKFGQVIAAECGWHVNEPSRWRRDKLLARLKESDTDWKRYQLNRPPRPFDARRYLEFRLFWPYSSGLPDQWLSHHVDTVAHVTGELYPASCVATGSISQWHDGRENADTFVAVFEYPSGFHFRYSARHTNSHGGQFARFFSNAGTLDLTAGTISPESTIKKKDGAVRESPAPRKLPAIPDESHLGNWLDSIRTRKPPAADIIAGYAHSVAVSMAVRALQTGRRVTFNPQTHEIV